VVARAAAYQRMVIWEERVDPAGGALVFDARNSANPTSGTSPRTAPCRPR
jgi:hypothetical protein